MRPISFRRVVSHVISHVVIAMDLYSISAIDRATTLYLLAFHDTGEWRRSM